MRLLVFFDLPVVRTVDRRNYARFRKFLLSEGFDMIQFSVYCRICNGMENVEKHLQRLKLGLPPKGSVRALVITEKQYARMHLLLGKRTAREELHKQPEQLLLL